MLTATTLQHFQAVYEEWYALAFEPESVPVLENVPEPGNRDAVEPESVPVLENVPEPGNRDDGDSCVDDGRLEWRAEDTYTLTGSCPCAWWNPFRGRECESQLGGDVQACRSNELDVTDDGTSPCCFPNWLTSVQCPPTYGHKPQRTCATSYRCVEQTASGS